MKLWQIIIFGLSSNLISFPLQAQIAIDGTTNTVLETNGNSIIINEGDRAGNNLFHSFQDFSIPTGNEAFFNNPVDISNIFSRVTGGNISNIDGLLRANGSANLFIINPAGIIFSEGASLDIGGSFFATTADSIVFSDDIEFSALDSDNTPLLTINQPIGLVLANNPGTIINRSIADDVGLQVSLGENLTLVGGNIEFNNGTIFAPGANIELGGLSATGEIGINADGSLNFPEGVTRGDVILTNGSAIDVRSGGGGNIKVNANNIEVSSGELGQSLLLAGIAFDSGSPNAQAGDIVFNATGDVNISDSIVSNNVEEFGIGNSGNINVSAINLSITEGSNLVSSTSGMGNSGNITIVTSDTVTVNGENSSGFTSFIGSLVRESGEGNAGNIEINSSNLFVTNGAFLTSSTFGQGNGGTISIDTSNDILIDGEDLSGSNSAIASQVDSGEGDGGNIEIKTNNLFVERGAFISTSTLGIGNAGKITIDASNSVSVIEEGTFSSSAIFSEVGNETAIGNAGDIEITTANLYIALGGFVSANTLGIGDSGKITINASDNVTIDAENLSGQITSFISSEVADTAEGNGEEVEINTTDLFVLNGAFISTSTFGVGSAGKITINASDNVLISGQNSSEFYSAVASQVGFETAVGNGGGIEINTTNLSLTEGGFIIADTFGIGNAGEIEINASDNVLIDGFLSSIYSVAFGGSIGKAGGINIVTDDLSVRNRGEIRVDSRSQTSGGNIFVKANSFSLNNKSFLTASTLVGKGGSIRLEIADSLILQNGSSIASAALESADGGNITINADSIVAFPNQDNDIIALAMEQGDGGNIDITTSAIFGIQERNSFSENTTNDLDASSQLGVAGTVSINELDVNPAEGLEELPTEVIDVANLVAQNLCQQNQGSEFILTGKGGLSSSPNQMRSSNFSEVDLVEPVREEVEGVGGVGEVGKVKKGIMEAQGWIINNNGKLQLIAQKTDVNSSALQPKYSRVCQK